MIKGQQVKVTFMGESFYGATISQAKAKLLNRLVNKDSLKVEVCCYEVKAGDTLYSIAKNLLGHGEAWPKIAKMNRTSIPDASKIYPGTVIYLPKYIPVEELKNG